jgi:hypothetical protein
MAEEKSGKTMRTYCINRFKELSDEEVKALTSDERRKYNQKLRYHSSDEYRKKQNEYGKARYAKIKEMLEMHKKIAEMKI